MMLDTDRRTIAASQSLPPSPIEFCTIELSPLADGEYFVLVTHTSFDDTVLELIDRRIVSEPAATIQAMLTLVAESVHTTFRSLPPVLSHPS